tara:strand:+ start:1595 stop:1876 length:282 start_codon:yes stop_codon:yes gene_type:complete
MNLEIKTEKELALLIFGMTLGHDLGFVEEHLTPKAIAFGAFEGTEFCAHENGTCSVESYENSEQYLAIYGALNLAQERAEQVFAEWAIKEAQS